MSPEKGPRSSQREGGARFRTSRVFCILDGKEFQHVAVKSKGRGLSRKVDMCSREKGGCGAISKERHLCGNVWNIRSRENAGHCQRETATR